MMNMVARAYGAPTYTITASAINSAASTTTRRLIALNLTPPLDDARGALSCVDGRMLFSNVRMKRLIIAIDGPSGAGKGTVSRALAQALGYRHVDTGAMYRAVGWKANHDGISLTDEAAVARLARSASLVVEGGVVTIDGHDVTSAIRTPDVDKLASTVARLPQVREVLVSRQRAIGEQGGVVMEGRDIGSVVFPDADVKIYLDASAEERARRRAHDSAHAGSQAGQAAVAEAIQARDLSDKTRAASPLALAPGAIHVDTTDMPISAVVEHVLGIVKSKLT